ncbi:hypothetical protein G4B88_005639 [Cannabis sativa]|uniref:Uncharacterized protein n=1 Tax=Cannabis sativa TaxID=3483 RepID=A0A7J6GBK2_CANSA|nr:hypothetical protein G4B88_005639 [Cannabis sativa]
MGTRRLGADPNLGDYCVGLMIYLTFHGFVVKGGADCRMSAMNEFQQALDKHGGAQVQERLDRYFCNQGRHDLFPSVKVINVDLFHSDHRPIVATLENIIRLRSNDKKRSFRFKTHWLKDATCHEIVNKTLVRETQKQLDDLLSVSAPLVRMDEVKRLEVKLKDLFSREECYWKLPVGRRRMKL